MSGSPEISIVMSVYNGADQLGDTIDSVLSQQGISLELIIVDDGSTDGSDVIIASYGVNDPPYSDFAPGEPRPDPRTYQGLRCSQRKIHRTPRCRRYLAA
jgi:glycosyltransferase involved in cell wall biosynthesis